MDRISPNDILSRIDIVLKENKRIEVLYLVLTGLLFLCGIASCVAAIMSKQYVWVTPSTATTFFLKWPLKEIKDIRRKNIALATAPILITQLPPDLAAKEIQKLLKNLYGEESK